MGVANLKALLVGESYHGSSHLAKRLGQHGCECTFADSLQLTCSLLAAEDFRLVLCTTKLHQSSLVRLIDLLEGSDVTLFCAYPVEDGCWWLPGLRRGKRCLGEFALCPSEFVSFLDKAIEEMRSAEQSKDSVKHIPFRRPAVSNDRAFSPIDESESASPVQQNASRLAKYKAVS